MTVAELDALPEADVTEALGSCCGAARWIQAMAARRPFRDRQSLLAAAGLVWHGLGPPDWKEAFTRHPRIGEHAGARQETARGQAWSAGEQAGVAGATNRVRSAIADANRQYEARFGYRYIVSAAGRSPEDLLGEARARLRNDPETELRVAAAEQLKITLLRLGKLVPQH